MAKTYIVTVTPKYKVYAGSWSNGVYHEEINAFSREDAIYCVRRNYNMNNDVPAKFTAKIKREEW